MRKTPEKFKIYQGVFDDHTFRVLYKLSEKYFDVLHGPISEGKEANVYLASKGEKHVAVKIFRFDTTSFTQIREYIVSDPRFPSFSKKHRNMIFVWCKKEYQNLLRAKKAGVSVPKPIAYDKNVIIMEFIGINGNAYPTANVKGPKNPEKWYKVLVDYYRKLLKVDLIHADFSKYNIINRRERPVIIDWGQGVLKRHSYSLKYLKRDVENLNKWFEKLGVKIEKNLFEDLKGEFYV